LAEHILGSTTRPYHGLTFAEACERIAGAGYTDVAAFSHNGEMPVDSRSTHAQVIEARDAASRAGVRPSMVLGRTHLDMGLPEATDDYRRLIDNCASLGASWVLELGTSRENHYEDYPKLMGAVVEHAAAAGIGISLKPHGGISLTAEELIDLHDQVDHPAFRISYDPGNIIFYTRGEVRPESEVELIASRTSTLIIKDCQLDGNEPDVMVTAGDGLVDFPFVISRMAAGGFSGPMYVECVGASAPDDVDTALRRTRDYVSTLM